MRYVYILRSLSHVDQLYVGTSESLDRRLRGHNEGQCLHTSKFRPWRIVYVEEFPEEEDALLRERQLKGWSRLKKEALIAGDRKELKRLARCRGRG